MADVMRRRALYKTAAVRYHLPMMPVLKSTRCGGQARARHRLVAFLNRFSGL
jgi:hypothetical protein